MIYIPNLLTLARIALVPVLIVLLRDLQFGWALAVFLIAGVSDALDGYIAKRFNARTYLGAILDPLADKALIVSAYVTLSVLTLVPFWLMVAVVFRDIIIIAGYLIMTSYFGAIEMKPLRVSKVNTFMQILYILLVLAALAGASVLQPSLPWLEYLVLATSVVSGGAYVYIWSVKATKISEELSDETANN